MKKWVKKKKSAINHDIFFNHECVHETNTSGKPECVVNNNICCLLL